MADQWEDALLDQYVQDDNAQVDAMTDAVSQSLAPAAPGAVKIGKDVAGGVVETGKAVPGALPRLVRGMLGIVESGLSAMPGSEHMLDVADRVTPQWWRDFAANTTDILDRGAAWGADPKTITGHLGKTGVDFGLNLLVLRRLGAFSAPEKIVRGAGLAKNLVPVAQEAGQMGMVDFLLAGDEKALARQTRDNIAGLLKAHPELQDIFLQTMTSEDPSSDALLAQSVSAVQTSLTTAGLMWLVPAFRDFRNFLGRKMTVEEAAKEFGLTPGARFRQRNIPQKWQGAEPTVLREAGDVELGAVERGATAKGVSGGVPTDIVVGAEAKAGLMVPSGSKGWVTREGNVVLADSHEATAEGFAKRYGLLQGEAAHDALGKGFIRWDAQGTGFHMETTTSKEALARARKVLLGAPDKHEYIVDLLGPNGATEFFQTRSKDEAVKRLDYFIEHGELPSRRSQVAQYLDETVPGGPNPSIIHDLTQAAEEAKGRLRLKINR